ncbi:unnamed protein product [Brassicogethes aeneus]|uniref:Major facilitator superfamily (MFS) profile domain-containing protein n=1 Tax=Brassicogethes aeneus TaxID=1431903 RepID=A0A9P0B5Z3_BRAAE|nr:unnamed protein product [Brassicogethes aeneus]
MVLRLFESKYIYFIVGSVNLVAFSVGTGMSWPSSQLTKLTNNVDNPLGRLITKSEAGWITSLSNIGGIIGPVVYGFFMETIGHRNSLIALGIPLVTTFGITAFAQNIYLYYIARFLLGIGSGPMFLVCAVYVAEIADNDRRALLTATTVIYVTTGTLFSYCVGPYTSPMVFNLILSAIPSLYIILVVLFVPESPHYLLKQGDVVGATRILENIRGYKGDDITREIEDLKGFTDSSHEEKARVIDLFSSSAAIYAFFMGLFLVTFLQVNGTGVFINYTEQIFDGTVSKLTSSQSAIVVGVIQVVFSPISPIFIQRFGRKTLLLTSIMGGIAAHTSLGGYFILQDQGVDLHRFSWVPLTSMGLFFFSFFAGFGCLPWAIITEIYPSHIKSMGCSVVNTISSMLGFLVMFYFNCMVDSIGMGYTFILFSGVMSVAWLIIFVKLPETKGKTFHEIQDIISGPKGRYMDEIGLETTSETYSE